MKRTKRLFAVLVAVVMLLGVVPVMNVGMTASAANGVKAKLDVFMQSYPSGSRWTGSFAGGSQCFGFGKMAIYNVFGTTSGGSYRAWNYAGTSLTGMTLVGSVTSFSSSSVQSLLSNARCGDILQFNTTKQHTMIVYAVNSSSVTIYDCNWDNNCGISLRDCSFGTWSSRNSSKLSLLRADNYDEVNGSDTSHDPIGSVDFCEGKTGYVWLRGWVFDPDSHGSTINVHVYIGADSSTAGGEGHSIWADTERNDVNNVYGCGDHHGFDINIDTDKTGEQDVYIYAINVGEGSTKLLDVITVTIDDPSPCGAIDHCEGGNGYIDIGGWAFDPDDTSQALQIHVYIGADSTANGGEGHSITANLERLDVNNYYHVGNNHGYNTVIYTSKTGNQPIYIYAINIGRGGNQLLGCPTVYITPHTHNYTSKVTTAATCTTAGVRTYTCSCGASYTETITALGHNYGAWTKLNDTQHQRVCSRNSSHVEKANHTWNSGVVTKAATCSATGVRTYTCSVCNGTKTETIAINASNHVNTTNVTATASTCTVKGYTAGVYCNDCKKYISGHQEQPLAAHTLTTINQRNATCTAEGYTGDQYCTTCKQTITTGTAIGKTAHTLTVINQRDATYDAEGYTGDQYCTTCKQTITTGTAIPKLEKPSDPTPTDPQPSNPQPSGGCKWCGQNHGGAFGWLVKLFHNLFAAIFGARY